MTTGRTNGKFDEFIGFILGLLCTINGFMFHIGSFNIRICDIMFFLIPLYGIIKAKFNRNYYPNSIIYGLITAIVLTVWIFLSGFIHYNDYSEEYQDFFLKLSINKTLWIPLYAIIYMIYGGKRFLYGVFLGISVCSLLNTVIIIYEYITIQNGRLPNYSFLNIIGIWIDTKKEMVINQNMIRPTGLMLDPNYTGGYTGIGVIFFDWHYKVRRKKLFALLSILCIVPMFLVFSRTGLFSIAICFIITVIIRVFSSNRKKPLLAPYVIFLTIVFAVLALAYIYTFDEGAVDLLIDRLSMKDSSSSVRTQYLEYYFRLASIPQVLLGVGFSGHFLQRFWGYTEVWAPESSFISLLIDNGVIFMLCYILLLSFVFVKLLRQNYYYAIILLYINCIGLSYNFLGDRVYYFICCCLIMFAFSQKNQRNKNGMNNSQIKTLLNGQNNCRPYSTL